MQLLNNQLTPGGGRWVHVPSADCEASQKAFLDKYKWDCYSHNIENYFSSPFFFDFPNIKCFPQVSVKC